MDINYFFVENVPFPYFILDCDLKVISKSNQAEKVLLHSDLFIELIDLQYQEEMNRFLHHMSTENFIEVPMNEIGGKKGFYQIYKANDKESLCHVYCIPIKTELANFKEMINMMERKLLLFNKDLKEKKTYIEKTVEEMKNAANTVDRQKTIENLAAGIAHEIRNPLTTVKGFLQLLKPYLIELGKVEYADVALEEINRANNIIYEFLNAAKPQSRLIQDISLNKVVKDIAILFESEAILKNIQIFTHFSSRDISINIPTNQLKQVLINLIKNAMEAIDENHEKERKINILTQTDAKYASIDIKDSGCGMTKEHIKNLFMPFYSTKTNGTGIGLSVSKKIIEDHGGSINVKSTVGKGTTFTISLPVNTITAL